MEQPMGVGRTLPQSIIRRSNEARRGSTEKEDPPYDRDRFLPKPDWTPVEWDEDEPIM